MRHPILQVLLGLYVLWGAWHWYIGRPVSTPDGVLAADDPLQLDVEKGETLQVGRWSLTERATYKVTARVLARESYHFDSLADLAPEDLALGWGPMSDNRVLKGIEISQSNRFYFWRSTTMPIPREAIIAHSANTHVIPGNAFVAKQLSRLRPGEIVTLTGELVDGRRDDGVSIRTSLSRLDTGAGACEVMWVSDVSL
jgi:hypothetical protein